MRFKRYRSVRVAKCYLGFSRPAVSDTAIFVSGDSNTIARLDRTNYEIVWSRRYADGPSWDPWGVFGDVVVARNGVYLHGIDASDGRLAWSRLTGQIVRPWRSGLLVSSSGVVGEVLDPASGEVCETIELAPRPAGSWSRIDESHDVFCGADTSGSPCDPFYGFHIRSRTELWRADILGEIRAHPPGLPSSEVITILGAHDGTLLFVAANGVFGYSATTGLRLWYTPPPGGWRPPYPSLRAGCIWLPMYEDALYAVSPASGTVLARIPRLEDAWPSYVSDEYGPYALSVWERGRIALLDGSTGNIVARYDGPTAMAWGDPPDLFLKVADGRLHVAREVGWVSRPDARRPTTA